jgi:hypothetical protein
MGQRRESEKWRFQTNATGTRGGVLALTTGRTNSTVLTHSGLRDMLAASGLLTVFAAPPANLPISLLELIGQ